MRDWTRIIITNHTWPVISIEGIVTPASIKSIYIITDDPKFGCFMDRFSQKIFNTFLQSLGFVNFMFLSCFFYDSIITRKSIFFWYLLKHQRSVFVIKLMFNARIKKQSKSLIVSCCLVDDYFLCSLVLHWVTHCEIIFMYVKTQNHEKPTKNCNFCKSLLFLRNQRKKEEEKYHKKSLLWWNRQIGLARLCDINLWFHTRFSCYWRFKRR